MSDAATLSMVENTLSDILFHVENEGKLPDFTNWHFYISNNNYAEYKVVGFPL